MKHPLLTIIVLVVIALLAICVRICAKTGKMPKGKLVSYQYNRGGGMNPLDYTIFHLRYDETTKKPLLTISGDCQGEEITVEVGQEVFDRCQQLIEEHKLYRSKGYYEPLFQVLDAPSDGFVVVFEDPYSSISGSGDMPSKIYEGLGAIHKYFKSVVGDRKAEGHVDRLYDIDDIANYKWTDGKDVITLTEASTDPLKLALRKMSDEKATMEDTDKMGYERFRDGDQHYIVIYDYKYDRCRLFFTFDGKESTLRQLNQKDRNLVKALPTVVKDSDKWNVVNERFLSRTIIDNLSDIQLKQMFAAISRLTNGPYSHIVKYTDIGGVNVQLLQSELDKRKIEIESDNEQ